MTGRDLTARESRVLALISRGWRPDQIAGELAVTDRTMTGHLRSIRRKLRATTDANAVAIAYQCGALGGSWRNLPLPPSDDAARRTEEARP